MDIYLPGKQTTSSMNNIIMSTQYTACKGCTAACACTLMDAVKLQIIHGYFAACPRVLASTTAGCTRATFTFPLICTVSTCGPSALALFWVLQICPKFKYAIQPYAAENWFSSTSVISVCLVLFLVSIWSSTLLFNGTLDTMVNDSH